MKNLTLRVLCLIVAAILSLALVACNNGTNTPANTTDTEADTKDTEADTKDTEANTQDTEADTKDTEADTEEPPVKVGATGLEAIKGTVPTYLSMGKQEHKNLKLGNKYGVVANIGGSFKSINLYTATYDHDNGDKITITVFAWNTDYETTAAGEAVATLTITGYPNGGWYMITFEQPLPAGEYLVEFTGTSDGDTTHDYGTAIWCMNSSPYFYTYENGVEMDDAGVWAQFIVE